MNRITRIIVTVLVVALVVYGWSVSGAQAQAQTDDVCTVIGNITGDPSPTLQPIIEGVPLAEQDHSKPLGGATLTFKGKGQTRQVRTNKHGDYKIALPSGSYIVKVNAAGFAPARQEATVEQSPNDNICLDLGFGLESNSAARQKARANAQIESQNASLARPYSATPAPITSALSADVQAFNDSTASQTPGCGAMAGILTSMAAQNRRPPTLGGEIINWSMEANAAKVCASDTRGSAAEHLPRFVLSRACGHLKDNFALVNAVYRSETSWACGWAAPIPALRTVPGIMPPGYDQ